MNPRIPDCLKEAQRRIRKRLMGDPSGHSKIETASSYSQTRHTRGILCTMKFQWVGLQDCGVLLVSILSIF